MNRENKEGDNEMQTLVTSAATYPGHRVEDKAAHLSPLSKEIHGEYLFLYCFSQRCIAVPVFGKERE